MLLSVRRVVLIRRKVLVERNLFSRQMRPHNRQVKAEGSDVSQNRIGCERKKFIQRFLEIDQVVKWKE